MNEVNILSIDPSLCNTALVVFQYTTDRPEWSVVSSHVIHTAVEAKKRGIYKADDETRRIELVVRRLKTTYELYSPKLLVAEITMGQPKSKRAASALAIAKTVIVTAGAIWGIPVVYVDQADVKNSMCNKKTASKTEMKNRAAELYPEFLEEYKSTKAADGWAGTFEHVADAVGVFEAVKHSAQVQLLRGLVS